MPRNIGPDYEEQLTDEYLRRTEKGFKWDDKGNNHLGDCEKYQLLIPTLIEQDLADVGDNVLKIISDRIRPKLLAIAA